MKIYYGLKNTAKIAGGHQKIKAIKPLSSGGLRLSTLAGMIDPGYFLAAFFLAAGF